MDRNCSNIPRGPCYPTTEPDEAVFTHNESSEKEKTALSFKALQEKAFDLSLCLWSRKGGSSRPSMTCSPCALQACEKGPGPMAAPRSHPRRTAACSERAEECICSITWIWTSFLSLHVSALLKCPPCPPEQRGGAQRQPQPPWWL